MCAKPEEPRLHLQGNMADGNANAEEEGDEGIARAIFAR